MELMFRTNPATLALFLFDFTRRSLLHIPDKGANVRHYVFIDILRLGYAVYSSEG